jgi:uncharacterized protein (DUF1778 family)
MSSNDKKIIETAAMFRGLRPNTYARQKLLEAAEKDVAEMGQLNTVILSEKDWDRMIAIMEAPVKVNKKLKSAVREFQKHKFQ